LKVIVDELRGLLSRVRVLIAEDHKEMRENIRRVLEPEFEVVGTVGDGQALIDEATRIKPDALLVDISMPLLNGIEAIRQLRKQGSTATVIFLTVEEDPSWVRAALRAGGLGYVIKMSMVAELKTAIRDACAGRVFVSPSVRFSLTILN
jgi:DNA-binding NarL/FixJ family response regulator